jgi:hypothetical protein
MWLVRNSTTPPVAAAAAAALGNLGYHHDLNRCSIVDAGGIEALVSSCSSPIADLHGAAVASLRNIIYNAPSARNRLYNEQVPLRLHQPLFCKVHPLTILEQHLSILLHLCSTSTSIAAICHGLTILKKCALSLTFAPPNYSRFRVQFDSPCAAASLFSCDVALAMQSSAVLLCRFSLRRHLQNIMKKQS